MDPHNFWLGLGVLAAIAGALAHLILYRIARVTSDLDSNRIAVGAIGSQVAQLLHRTGAAVENKVAMGWGSPAALKVLADLQKTVAKLARSPSVSDLGQAQLEFGAGGKGWKIGSIQSDDFVPAAESPKGPTLRVTDSDGNTVEADLYHVLSSKVDMSRLAEALRDQLNEPHAECMRRIAEVASESADLASQLTELVSKINEQFQGLGEAIEAVRRKLADLDRPSPADFEGVPGSDAAAAWQTASDSLSRHSYGSATNFCPVARVMAVPEGGAYIELCKDGEVVARHLVRDAIELHDNVVSITFDYVVRRDEWHRYSLSHTLMDSGVHGLIAYQMESPPPTFKA